MGQSQQVAHPERLSALERSLVDAISLDEPWDLLEEFADLTRVTGTDDEERAAEYLTGRLDHHGVDHDRYDPELYISQPHGAELRVEGREFDPGPLKTVAFSAADTASGPVEYVGSAGTDLLNTDEGGVEEPYGDVGDLSGTVALTAAGSISIRGMRALEAKNAEGIVCIHEHDEEPHSGIATPVWGGAPPLDEKDRIPDVPIVNVRKPAGERLREWAEADEEVEVELSTDLTTDWMECPVVVADIEGGADDTDDFLLLHGHYDSWFVGVTDNATGDATLLELARVLADHSDRLRRNVKVAWWPGHSTGRYAGSTWFADEFAADLDRYCVAHVNCDSPGAKDATEYTDMSCWTPEAHEHVGRAIEDVTDAPYEEYFPHRAGDYSFDNLGISGFFMLSSNIPADVREERGYHQVGGCGGNSDAWHLSTDTLDKAGEEELLRDMRLYAVAVARVLDAEVLPLNHARNARTIRERVEAYDDAAGEAFDLSPTLDRLRGLEDDLDAFYDAVDAGDVDAETANETIKRLSRTLTRVNLVERGQFEQDPATSRDPVPRLAPARRFDDLDDDDRRFLRVQLKREQNRLVAELREARERLPTA